MGKKLIVVVDPGHGMGNRRRNVYDPGAVANGKTEAELVLQLALTMKYIALHHPEFKGKIDFRLTRSNASDNTSLNSRVLFANKNNADIFISLHNNAASPKATGTETFYRDSKDKKLAEVIQDAALKAFGLRDRGVKHESKSHHRRLGIFNAQAPTALLETGFITNLNDLQKYSSREARIEFAIESLRGILKTYA